MKSQRTDVTERQYTSPSGFFLLKQLIDRMIVCFLISDPGFY